MAWHRLGDKPLSGPMLVSLLIHVCATRPQGVNAIKIMVADVQVTQGAKSSAVTILT